MKEKPIAFLQLVRHLEEAVGERTGYALLDPFSCQTLMDGRPAIVAIQSAGKIIAQHLGLADYVFVIVVTNQKPNTAGHIELDHSDRYVFVELSPEVCGYKDAVLAVLCHELSHKFLHTHGIKIGTTVLEQEFLTDVTAVYLGLGKIMLNGCECRSVKQRTQDGKTSTETHVLRTGYISRDCFAFVYRLVCAMRRISRDTCLRGLSVAAREAVQAVESKYANWFSPEFCGANGVAMLGDDLKAMVEACQDEAAARHRTLRTIDETFRSIGTRINKSHMPLKEAQQQIAWLSEPQPNPHILFLNCVQTRESIAELLSIHELQMKDLLPELKQVETMVSWRYRPRRGNSDEIVECPLDGSSLRVPVGRKRFLVTCPSCKYRFLVNTGQDREAGDLGQVPWKLIRTSKVLVPPSSCLVLALLFLGYVVKPAPGTISDSPAPQTAQGWTVSDSPDPFTLEQQRKKPESAPKPITLSDGDVDLEANRQQTPPPQTPDPWAVKSIDDEPGGNAAAPPPPKGYTLQGDTPPRPHDKPLVDVTSGDVELDQPPSRVRSLPTGTRLIADHLTTGHGELEVINGTRYDACLIVMDASTQLQVRKVYLRARDSLTLGRLSSGEYSVFFQTGEDWDNSTEDFNRHASYYQFGTNLTFEETSDAEAIHYQHHAITLNPVLSGNIQANSLNKAQFHSFVGGM